MGLMARKPRRKEMGESDMEEKKEEAHTLLNMGACEHRTKVRPFAQTNKNNPLKWD